MEFTTHLFAIMQIFNCKSLKSQKMHNDYVFQEFDDVWYMSVNLVWKITRYNF
jgi:hypothetical protein